MIQFYAPDIPDSCMLPADESRHCSKVLRHNAGDIIFVVDGKGNRFECRILDPDQRATMLEIVSQESIPNHWGAKITLAVAPTKNMDRMEWLTEKGVEIGVDRIIPVLCEHSERKVIKPGRLENIAISAMKQSLKTSLPEISPLLSFRELLALLDRENTSQAGIQKFMGYCDSNYPRLPLVSEYTPHSDVILLIGPEGDFSSSEVAMATDAGFIPVTFGQSRLRTETAAISALDTIHLLNYQHDYNLSRKLHHTQIGCAL